MKRQIRAYALAFALILPLLSPAAQQTAPNPKSLPELQAAIAALIDQPRFAPARWGIRIITDGGDVVFERDADKLFMPASNMKLYTTAASLDAFGADFKFKTSVYAPANGLKGRVLRGDLILVGRGDPNLSARFDADAEGKPNPIDSFTTADTITAIEQLADQIRMRGIRSIQGNVAGDDSYFTADQWGAGWEWDDLLEYYGAPVSALTINDNVVRYLVVPAKREGKPPVITSQPATAYGHITNNAVTGPGKDGKTHLLFERKLNGTDLTVTGNIPKDAKEFRTDIAVESPAAFAATLLREALMRRGIRVAGKAIRIDATARVKKPLDESKLTEVASIESQPMSLLLKVINKPSQNLHAEIMLRQLGELRGGPREIDDFGRPSRSDARGIAVLRQFLTKAGVDVAPLSLRDGSGLARQDMISPRSTSQLLLFMSRHRLFQVFRDSLPHPGDGTLRSRMRGTVAEGRLEAKTGSLAYVRALSGYVGTIRGKMLIFSFMANNYTGPGNELTAVFDQIGALLAGYDGEFQRPESSRTSQSER